MTGDEDVTADDVLPCGRPAAPLLELILEGRVHPPDDERDEHQRTCPHCRALVDDVERRWSAVTASLVEPETPPADLVDAVMGRVRALGPRTGRVVLPGDRGETRVRGVVLQRVAEQAAGRVPGVSLALVRDVGEGTGGAPAALVLSLVAVHGRDLPALAELVRREVGAALAAVVGVDGVRVDVRVDDLAVG